MFGRFTAEFQCQRDDILGGREPTVLPALTEPVNQLLGQGSFFLDVLVRSRSSQALR